jgi:hypothetical protein
VSCQPPSNHTGRVPRAAASSDALEEGASTDRSKAGRRPIAAVRSDTMRTGMPGSSRLNAAA